MAKKIKYYDIKPVLKTDATWIILYGQRANGKSYAAKRLALENAFKNHHKFIYLRRWQMDIKQDSVTAYFGDMPIIEITNGQYVGVVAYHGYIYFYNLDDDDNIIRGETIGRYCALNEAERYKSQTFIDYDFIIYEEFITNQMYLDDEPMKLQQFASTVYRHSSGKVILIGNTLSRVCPYWKEWVLDGVLRQKPGTIDIYNFHVKDSIIKIAVEYCETTNYENKMFFGQTAKQILSGEWETQDVNKLPKPQDYYDWVYTIKVCYQDFKFMMNLLIGEEGERVVYVYPLTHDKDVARVLTDAFSDDILVNARLNLKCKPEKLIAECFALNKVCYSDNLTGSDFRNVNEHFDIARLF